MRLTIATLSLLAFSSLGLAKGPMYEGKLVGTNPTTGKPVVLSFGPFLSHNQLLEADLGVPFPLTGLEVEVNKYHSDENNFVESYRREGAQEPVFQLIGQAGPAKHAVLVLRSGVQIPLVQQAE